MDRIEWLYSRSDAARLEVMGLGVLAVPEPAPLTPENAMAVHVWQFIDGWQPDRLPLAVGLYDIQDVDGLIERLMVIRDGLKEAGS